LAINTPYIQLGSQALLFAISKCKEKGEPTMKQRQEVAILLVILVFLLQLVTYLITGLCLFLSHPSDIDISIYRPGFAAVCKVKIIQ
jgi:hypothetical protein